MRIRYHRTEPTRAMTIVFLRAIVALLIMAAAMSQIGCESAPQKPKTVSEAIVAAQTTVTTAANTLADLADAGIVSRESDDYRRIADALLEARDMVSFAWSAYLAGDTSEATQWRNAALSAYARVRPHLEKLAEGN